MYVHNEINDAELEIYLKAFRPLPPAPLPKRPRRWSLLVLSAAAAILLAVLMRPQKLPDPPGEPHPFTIHRADALLANTSNWQSVLDDTGFTPGPSPPQPKTRSALEFLSQENLLP